MLLSRANKSFQNLNLQTLKRIIEYIIIGIYWCAFCNAQQAVSTAGGEATGAGGTMSFTIGQSDYITITGNSGMVMQGVQQPFEILVVTGIESDNKITLECTVYPNPATDFLTLKIPRDYLENPSYQLLDINGKLLKVRLIEKAETSISLQDCPPATYLLKVVDKNKEIKTFQIIKN